MHPSTMKRRSRKTLFWRLSLAFWGLTLCGSKLPCTLASPDRHYGKLNPGAPGVAFSLRPDYLMAAVRTSRQEPVAIARVEGTVSYKKLMRVGATQALAEPTEYSPWCAMYNDWMSQPLQDYLGWCHGDPDVDAMRSLLGQLKVAVETYLGHTVCLVSISVLDSKTTGGRLDQVIDTAMANLGLTQALRLKPDASMMVLLNEGWWDIEYEPFQSFLFLVVESDQSGTINLDLEMIDEGVPDLIQRYHNVTGTAMPTDCLGDRAVTVKCEELATQRRSAIRDAIATFYKPPFPDWHGETPPSLSRVVIHGDAANDTVLHEELRMLFGSGLPSKIITREPMYASTFSAATQALNRINGPYPDREASFWCCLRSWEKACPRGSRWLEL